LRTSGRFRVMVVIPASFFSIMVLNSMAHP
jgi:hypothetical protein